MENGDLFHRAQFKQSKFHDLSPANGFWVFISKSKNALKNSWSTNGNAMRKRIVIKLLGIVNNNKWKVLENFLRGNENENLPFGELHKQLFSPWKLFDVNKCYFVWNA